MKTFKWSLGVLGGLVLLSIVAVATSPTTQTTSVAPAQTVQAVQQPSVQAASDQPAQQTELSNQNTYTNVDGNTVHSPAYSETGSVPAGATARCGNGTYSFSQNHSGTCSHNGGVAEWLQ